MPNRVALGIGGLEADPGDHICGVFSGEEERDLVLIPFLQAGLASGDKCICVIDGTAPGQIVSTLGPGGEAAALTAGKQLEVIGASEMYLRSGRFSAGEVIGVWKAAISDAMYAGQFDAVRVVETWSRRGVIPDVNEWVTEQFMKNLAEFDLEKPWFWDLFTEELDFAHHSFQLGLYTYRTTLWFDVAMPDAAEREWLNAKYPRWEETYGALWDQLERRREAGGEAGTLSYGLPALCNLCQLPALFIRPGRNTACTLELGGRRYLFCSEPCRSIFEQESSRFADHNSVVDRIVAGEAPGKLTDLHTWMGLQAPAETGKDLRRGLDPWRLDPVPKR